MRKLETDEQRGTEREMDRKRETYPEIVLEKYKQIDRHIQRDRQRNRRINIELEKYKQIDRHTVQRERDLNRQREKGIA